jgi:hypothetical protein
VQTGRASAPSEVQAAAAAAIGFPAERKIEKREKAEREGLRTLI